jgi:hypothetical protein
MRWIDLVREWASQTFGAKTTKTKAVPVGQASQEVIPIKRCVFSSEHAATDHDVAARLAEAFRLVRALLFFHRSRPAPGDLRITPEGRSATDWCDYGGCACINTGVSERWFFTSGATVRCRPALRPDQEPDWADFQVHFPDGCQVQIWRWWQNPRLSPSGTRLLEQVSGDENTRVANAITRRSDHAHRAFLARRSGRDRAISSTADGAGGPKTRWTEPPSHPLPQGPSAALYGY